jgi:hypothetical protein
MCYQLERRRGRFYARLQAAGAASSAAVSPARGRSTHRRPAQPPPQLLQAPLVAAGVWQGGTRRGAQGDLRRRGARSEVSGSGLQVQGLWKRWCGSSSAPATALTTASLSEKRNSTSSVPNLLLKEAYR